ncbi:MAG: DUF885 family protein [Alphaproteobacteria bacterium]|nr:DUF885 family protein [Alphaproteobacteria bacterium]
MRSTSILLALAACTHAAVTPAVPAEPTTVGLRTLPIPGPDDFVAIARDVLDAIGEVDPSVLAGAGLVDDAVRVPHLDEPHRAASIERLDRDLAALRALPWRDWDVHTQVDVRWVYAVAETTRHTLAEEDAHTHRPAQWLEPVSNTLIAFASDVPERPELQDRLLVLVPAMLDEMRAVCVSPTARDLAIAIPTARAIEATAELRGATEVVEALRSYVAELEATTPDRDFAVVGPDAYAWRLRHQLMLPWTPEELVARADAAQAEVEAALADLPPRTRPPPATDEQRAEAEALDRDGFLALYQGMAEANREATLAGGWVSIPDGVGPIRVRETPDAIVAISGDGGSMNPPPAVGASNVGWWNVEHFASLQTPEDRLATVTAVHDFRRNGLGPYAAHEGIPGHHLQLSVARLNPDPLRSILQDMVTCEGWGLYVEEVFWAHGGLGDDPLAHTNVLHANRGRILRVKTDVMVETGQWTLEQAAAFRRGTPDAEVDEEVLRAVNWPTQLVTYFAGKTLLRDLRAEVEAKRGDAFDERAFHDELLAAGTIPIALIRAEMLGEPVPDLGEVVTASPAGP